MPSHDGATDAGGAAADRGLVIQSYYIGATDMELVKQGY